MPRVAETANIFAKTADKKRLLDRLARVEGQLRGIQKMIADEKECELVAQQLAAARGGLNRAFFDLIACAFETKLAEAGEPSAEMRQKLTELAALLTKYA